jgi:hypothetical protein
MHALYNLEPKIRILWRTTEADEGIDSAINDTEAEPDGEVRDNESRVGAECPCRPKYQGTKKTDAQSSKHSNLETEAWQDPLRK